MRSAVTQSDSSVYENATCARCAYALHPETERCTNRECPEYGTGSGVISGAELLRQYAPPPLFHGRQWGQWTFDSERLCLVFEASPVTRGGVRGVPSYVAFLGRYEIDLERVRDSAAMLDWIFQIQGKTWASARVTKDLLNAFDSIFNPQANLCSGACGSGRGGMTISKPSEFLRARIATVGCESARKVHARP